jgi:hypothetical protein
MPVDQLHNTDSLRSDQIVLFVSKLHTNWQHSQFSSALAPFSQASMQQFADGECSSQSAAQNRVQKLSKILSNARQMYVKEM